MPSAGKIYNDMKNPVQKDYNIILGSGSPRRKELLADLGVEFTVRLVKGVEEVYPDTLPVDEIPEYLSKLKANAYTSLIGDKDLVITADTIVIAEGKPMGKPKGHDDAVNMLKILSGSVHKVITGVTLQSKEKSVSFSVLTLVEFAELDDEEIEYYVDKYKPFDKAGAYGIQEWIGCMGVKKIEGSFYNVMGLPLHRLYTELKKF